MFEFESVAKSVDKAIEEGLLILNLKEEDVDIKIIETGGFFKKAKVLLIIPEEIANTNEEILKLRKLKELEQKVEKQESRTEILSTKQETESIEPKEIKQAENCKQFLCDFFEEIKLEATVETKETENEIFVNINGENTSKLIGYHGESLNSLQYVLSVYCSKFSRHTKKIILDIDGFKEKRKDTLEQLANRIAIKVSETGKKTELEPMNAFERRVIHNVVQNYSNLQSYSKGDEPNRFLVIDIKKE
ncbi:MAG: KH domain-containing protein [Clostridia bacterium]|nr:KH domain-containing protein [Clostridia bacterium]